MSANSSITNALSNFFQALSAQDQEEPTTQTQPTTTGFENVSAPTDNGLNTKIYLRSQAQEVPSELVGNITYEELVDKYFSIGDSYSVTVVINDSSTPVEPSDIYGKGVQTIIVTEQTASLG